MTRLVDAPPLEAVSLNNHLGMFTMIICSWSLLIGCGAQPGGEGTATDARLSLQSASLAGTRYNLVQQISSHNSYDNNGPKDDIATQFRMGVRSFELDLHISNEPANWGIYHVFPPGDFVKDLRDGLAQFKALHSQFPNHEVVTIWLELKDDWAGNGHRPPDLDSRISQDLPEMVYRPRDLSASTANATNLRDTIRLTGWPTLESLRGKFLFVMMGNDQANFQYLAMFGKNGCCFAAPEEDLEKKFDLNPGDPWSNSIFFNCHNIDGLQVPQRVYRSGLVSRIWRVDDQGEYDFALSSMAHHIATDHVTRDLFSPRLVDAAGNPFRPFGQ
jgi:hypothetical protein